MMDRDPLQSENLAPLQGESPPQIVEGVRLICKAEIDAALNDLLTVRPTDAAVGGELRHYPIPQELYIGFTSTSQTEKGFERTIKAYDDLFWHLLKLRKEVKKLGDTCTCDAAQNSENEEVCCIDKLAAIAEDLRNLGGLALDSMYLVIKEREWVRREKAFARSTFVIDSPVRG